MNEAIFRAEKSILRNLVGVYMGKEKLTDYLKDEKLNLK